MSTLSFRLGKCDHIQEFGPISTPVPVLSKIKLCCSALVVVAVGAEVSVGSGLTNYLMQPSVLGHEAAGIGDWFARSLGGSHTFNAAQMAGAMVSIYWGLAMVGRFVGSAVLARLSPAGFSVSTPWRLQFWR